MVLRSVLTASRHPFARLNEEGFTTLQKFLRGYDEACSVASCATSKSASLSVRLDVSEDENAFHVIADLPGFSENEVEATFDEGVLSIRGERKIVRDGEKDNWHVTERSSGTFVRQISMPDTVDAEKIEAKFEKGVLRLTLPKKPAEAISAKKINIKAG